MKVENVYVRSKSVFINEKAAEELSLFAGLHQVTLKDADKYKHQRVFSKVKVLRSELLEMLVKDAPRCYKEMPDHELRVVLTDDELKSLQYISEEDIERFYTYQPKEKEDYEVEYTETS